MKKFLIFILRFIFTTLCMLGIVLSFLSFMVETPFALLKDLLHTILNYLTKLEKKLCRHYI